MIPDYEKVAALFTVDDRDTVYKLKRAVEHIYSDHLAGLFHLCNIKNVSWTIAGGVFASVFHGEVPRDIDVFLLDCDSGITKSLDKDDYNLGSKPPIPSGASFNTPSRWPQIIETFYYHPKGEMILPPLNIIVTGWKTRKEVVDHFDYRHCCVSFQNGTLFISKDVFDAISKKHLILNDITYPPSAARIEKFIKRGFVIR